ncbi:MAG: polysaccharide pyruvyl transferase family protein [Clostridia bacterium]|nr:polysaccharide pyruvyl transferase family protein [Clostridia bacterium]
MKKVMLYQHAGSYNHGCEALATTVSAEIKRAVPDLRIYLCSHDSKEDREFPLPDIDEIIENKRWLRRWSLPWLFYQVDKRTFNCKALQEKIEIDKPCLKLAEQMDVCVAIGGDNYCYNKGKLYWPTERVIKKMGKKMMLWGCSVEPNELPGELCEHLSLFDAITVRESISYEAFVKCGLGEKAHLVADPAFLLEPETVELPEGFTEGQIVGINLSPMILNYTENRDKVVESVYALVDHILKSSEMNVLLVPHVRLPVTDDMDTLRPIYERYKDTGRVALLDDYSLSCRQLKGYISKCRFFIGARTHSIIAAYSTCVPALALGYSVKAKGIARDIFGTEENLVLPVQTFDDPEATVQGFEYLREHERELKEKLESVMPSYKENARKSAEIFESLV